MVSHLILKAIFAGRVRAFVGAFALLLSHWEAKVPR